MHGSVSQRCLSEPSTVSTVVLSHGLKASKKNKCIWSCWKTIGSKRQNITCFSAASVNLSVVSLQSHRRQLLFTNICELSWTYGNGGVCQRSAGCCSVCVQLPVVCFMWEANLYIDYSWSPNYGPRANPARDVIPPLLAKNVITKNLLIWLNLTYPEKWTLRKTLAMVLA